jgi:hypothetical protein
MEYSLDLVEMYLHGLRNGEICGRDRSRQVITTFLFQPSVRQCHIRTRSAAAEADWKIRTRVLVMTMISLKDGCCQLVVVRCGVDACFAIIMTKDGGKAGWGYEG